MPEPVAGRVRGLVAMAPHVLVEDISIAGIQQAKRQLDNGDVLNRLGQYHIDPEATFRGWNDTWLRPSFRAWNIESFLSGIACPVLMIQGQDDEYATMAQLDAIETAVTGPTIRLELSQCGHCAYRDQPAAVTDAIGAMIEALPRDA